ncbi:hypothetical protein BT69DRAFT_1279460 [Atractiella rhizophila]|nr:hypothetical protein BT69DRAFT_1279460 [Atractiella rhizophila]
MILLQYPSSSSPVSYTVAYFQRTLSEMMLSRSLVIFSLAFSVLATPAVHFASLISI